MKPGGGKVKGGEWERKVCVLLSLWVSHGANKDLFWRSALSGGRATSNRKRTGTLIRQCGDICAVAPEGHTLTSQFYIECKHVRSLDIASFLLRRRGQLAAFWHVTCQQAFHYDREPLLIAKQNNMPTIVLTLQPLQPDWNGLAIIPSAPDKRLPWGAHIYLLDDMLRSTYDDRDHRRLASATKTARRIPLRVSRSNAPAAPASAPSK